VQPPRSQAILKTQVTVACKNRRDGQHAHGRIVEAGGQSASKEKAACPEGRERANMRRSIVIEGRRR
jgi:hypothetical protein